jgi:site-specific DNA recombinase
MSENAKLAMRAVLYARVSTQQQKKAETIVSQLDQIERYAESQGFQVVEVVTDDGVTAALPMLERPGARRVLELVRSGGVDCVVTQNHDRVARDDDAVELMLFMRLLREHDAQLWTPRGHVDDSTPDGRLFLGIQANFASYERHRTRERTARGRRHKLRNGGRPRGIHHLAGYTWDHESRRIVVEPETEKLVMEVFRLAAEDGLSATAIARNLKARGIEGTRGKFMYASTVRTMVERETYYTGKYAAEKSLPDIVHDIEPLVTEETWRAANDRISRNKGFRGVPSDFPFLLRRLTVCPLCGRKMRAQHAKGRYPYYRCERGVVDPLNGERCAARKGIRADHVDKAVWERISHLIREPDALRAEVERMAVQQDDVVDDLRRDLAQVEEELAHLESRRSRLVEAVMKGLLADDDVLRERQALDEARQPLHRRRNTLKMKIDALDAKPVRLAMVESRISAIRDSLDRLTPVQKQEVVRELVEEVRIDTRTGDVEIRAIILIEDDENDGSNGASGSGGGDSFSRPKVYGRECAPRSTLVSVNISANQHAGDWIGRMWVEAALYLHDAGWSQAAIGEMAGCSRQTVGRRLKVTPPLGSAE